MGRAIVGAVLGIVFITVVGVLATVVFVGGSAGSECDARLIQHLGDQDLDADQLNTVQVIITVVQQRSLPDRAAVIAVSTSLVEATLHNLPTGDRDSLGIFQQRPSQGWGTPEQIMDPVYATGKFLDALVVVSGWETMPPGVAAQTVQRSAYPDRYAPQEWPAQRLIAGVRARVGNLPSPCAPPPAGVSPNLPEVVRRALTQLGKPYCWAGGSSTGPTPGDGSSPPPCGSSSPGFDCSGLMLYAFGPYRTLPRTSRAQYSTPGSIQVAVADAQPGDLLFWGYDRSNPASIHHVAMVVASGVLVEAPEDGLTVRQRPYSADGPGLMPMAVRVGAA
ncbi:C40 family peptidase [Actinokineospora enzanensis]|uniref:C40 family peptidase n=1 Tax=Actinokineospora enzanensis TaxID=155975 RepID=UPI0003A2424E|nr:NlpC/P60 family protein [Actinokineospora enzanensis]